jgi:arylsulfatase A-like enzyme
MRKFNLILTGVLIIIIIISLLAIKNPKITGKVIFGEEDYKCPNCNVILISIDTLRADHFGCYGYEKNTTPNIDEFAKDSVLFKETIAQAPSTLPSHASIFTSLIPTHHGTFISRKTQIPRELITMPEILKENNYTTISYNGGGQVSAKFGFDSGFDIYESWPSKNIIKENFIQKVNKSINWMNENNENKFFLFLHTFEVHIPYTPKKEYLELLEKDYSGNLSINISRTLLNKINNRKIKMNEEDKQHIINAYDAEIYSMDYSFGKLIDFLKQEGLYDSTIIIFTSDHGEEFNEHGYMGLHSHALYDEQLKVPLIIKFPKSTYASEIINKQVRSIDILPTLLDILNVRSLDSFEGISLINMINSENIELFAISQQDVPTEKIPTTIRTKKWKLYNERLFDLETDPLEKRDVSKEYPLIKKYLVENLNKTLQQKENISAEKAELDERTLEQLKSLGYIN